MNNAGGLLLPALWYALCVSWYGGAVGLAWLPDVAGGWQAGRFSIFSGLARRSFRDGLAPPQPRLGRHSLFEIAADNHCVSGR